VAMPVVEDIEIFDFSLNAHSGGDCDGPTTRTAVRVLASDGYEGLYVSPAPLNPLVKAGLAVAGDFVVGANALSPSAIFEAGRLRLYNYAGFGLGPLDIALWDQAAKRANSSVADLLGADASTIDAALTIAEVEGPSEDLDCQHSKSITAISKLGLKSIVLNVKPDKKLLDFRVKLDKLAQAYPRSLQRHLDLSSSVSDFSSAVIACNIAKAAGFDGVRNVWRKGLASPIICQRLAERVKVRIFSDQYLVPFEVMADLLAHVHVDAQQLDPDVYGISGVSRLSSIAKGFGIEPAISGFGPAHRHLVALTLSPFPYCLPAENKQSSTIYRCGYREAVTEILRGQIGIPKGPGLGVAYDWNLISRNRIN